MVIRGVVSVSPAQIKYLPVGDAGGRSVGSTDVGDLVGWRVAIQRAGGTRIHGCVEIELRPHREEVRSISAVLHDQIVVHREWSAVTPLLTGIADGEGRDRGAGHVHKARLGVALRSARGERAQRPVRTAAGTEVVV